VNQVYASAAQDAADDYRNRGWAPIPVKRRSKAPKLAKGHPFLSRPASEQEFANFDFRHNVGLATGKVSRVIVLDDDDDGETLRENGWHVPVTPTVKTRRGYQYYLRCPDDGFPTFDVVPKHLEVRADGAYVVAPPSIHPSGDRYEWAISPDEAELADPPQWLMEQARAHGRRMQAEDVGEVIAEGSRNKVLFSIAGTLRRRGLDGAGIYAALVGINQAKCETPLDEDEVHKIAQSATRYKPNGQTYNTPPADEEDKVSINPLLAGRVDLGKAIAQGIDPPDELEPDLLLDGKIHHFFGPSESGKTILALWMIKSRVEAREHVIMFDAENGARTNSERLKQMGADPDLIGKYLVYLPFPDLTLGERGRQDFYELLDEIDPVLIVFDSWASFLSSAGFSENDNAEIEHWDNALTKRAKQRGIASVILDHVPHDVDRSRGGARKKEVADVQWQVKKTQDFDRDGVGEVLLIKHKDREGWLPPTIKFSVGGRFGKLVCHRSAGTVEEPDAAGGLTRTEHKVLDTLRDEFPLTGARMAEWQRATDGRSVSRASHYRAVKKLVSLEVSPAYRVRQVNETYFPPDSTEPPYPDETSKNGVDKPDSGRSHEVSNRSHETSETPADGGGLTGLSPLKGETMRPAADTNAPTGDVTPEHQRRIRKLVQQGMSEKLAREEVFGKGWAEP
jgi:Bifunctional DNA primase/polymerase, N-terminal/Primase C terminal 1 (PriCT-1)/AAA domain